MKRSEFLRTLLLGAVAIPIVGTELLKESDNSWNRDDFTANLHSILNKKRIYFKISNELLKDSLAFELVLKDNGYTDKEIKSIVVGYEDDDFIKNQYTCLLTYVE